MINKSSLSNSMKQTGLFQKLKVALRVKISPPPPSKNLNLKVGVQRATTPNCITFLILKICKCDYIDYVDLDFAYL
jgi:hypothetical protein